MRSNISIHSRDIHADTPTSCTITGLDNGTPYQFTVVASNESGDGPESTASAAVTPSADLVFVGASPSATPLATGTVGNRYSAPIVVSGGLPPYVFSLTGNLPAGLDFDTANGTITGIPTASGSSEFAVTASDLAMLAKSSTKAASVHSATQRFSIKIEAAAPSLQAVPALGSPALFLLTALLGGWGLRREILARRRKQPGWSPSRR